MQTCSNCGSVSRDGAKFCTTCGSRLNEVIDSNASNGWESYSTEDETREAPAVAQGLESPVVESASPEVYPDQAAEPAPATSWSWGQSSADADAEPESDQPVSPEEDTEVATSSTDSESLSSWANQWTSPAEEPDEPDPVTEPEYDVTSEVDESETTVEAVAEAEVERDEPTVETSEAAPVVTYADPANVASDTPTPKERAQSLLFELRELIDESFAVSGTQVPASSGGDTSDALTTLNAVGSDNGQFDNLRAILEKAREQPRDVDTMLNLLGEINSLIALVDSHERLVTAVETAKSQLS
jgi:hypothetical protein